MTTKQFFELASLIDKSDLNFNNMTKNSKLKLMQTINVPSMNESMKEMLNLTGGFKSNPKTTHQIAIQTDYNFSKNNSSIFENRSSDAVDRNAAGSVAEKIANLHTVTNVKGQGEKTKSLI